MRAPSWDGLPVGKIPVPVTSSRSIADGKEPGDPGVVAGVPAGTIARYSTPAPLHLAGRYSDRSEHDHGMGGASCSGVAAIPGYGASADWEPLTALPDEHLIRG